MNSNASLYNAHWLVSEYISDIKDYLNKNSLTIDDWDEKYKKLPEYSKIFNDEED